MLCLQLTYIVNSRAPRNQAITFHHVVNGIISPYHVVVIVTTAHQNVCGIDLKLSIFHQFFSKRYTRVEDKINTISIINTADKYSTLFFIIHLQKIVNKTHAADLSQVFKSLTLVSQRKLFNMIKNIEKK